MSTTGTVRFRRFDVAGARELRDTVALIHRGAYAASSDAFASESAFMRRFDAYTARPGFDLVVVYQDNEPIGQTWGWALTPNTAWWNGLVAEPEPGFTLEDGHRTFALSELMVRQPWTGRGIAHALHDELLRHRPETRATLLVRPENTTASRAYLRWGWHRVAQLRPGWPDAPLMDVLTIPLPLGR
ncbi:MAG: GNAT family N-acetyltransferase [Pseudonocardiaceae bacterium]